MSDICKINVSMLKSYENDFKKESNNFNNKTYTTFSSSYLKKCSDTYVRRMSNELQILYDNIKNGYQNIDKWWVDYNENVEGLENYLSDKGSVSIISESSVINSINQLPNLKKYNVKFAGFIPATIVNTKDNTIFPNNTVTSFSDMFDPLYSDYKVSEVNAGKIIYNNNNINLNYKVISPVNDNIVNWDKTTEWWNDTTQKIDNWFDEVGTNISNGVKSLWADITGWWSEVENWWNDDALPWITNAAEVVWDVVKSVGATIAVFVQSLVEGILQFGEAIIDFAKLTGTIVASIITGLIDGGQAIYGAITGNDWSSLTKQMWIDTMGFISNQYVSGWFDSLYQNTSYGQWLAENAYGFDITRTIGNGIGYIAGVVILTIATFGVGGIAAAGGSITFLGAVAATTTTQMALIATAAGIGKGTQNAWADGANLLEGLTTGTLTGLWEGLQFYIGGKISKLNLFGTDGILKTIGSSGLGTKLLNGFARVVLDGADGGVEGFIMPLITSIYKDGYYDENGNYVEFLDDSNMFDRYREIFEDNGGWSAVWTQAAIGSAASLLGEIFDLRRFFNEKQNNSNITKKELQVKIDRYNELNNIKKSEEYLSYMDSIKKGDPVIIKPEFDGLEKELVALETELGLIYGITSKVDVDATLDIPEKIAEDNIGNTSGTAITSGQSNSPLSFSKEYYEAREQLSDYYGDAGRNINYMLLHGRTVNQLLNELDGDAKIKFQNFLQNTRQGRYLASLTDDEIRSIIAYTDGSFRVINSMLRRKDVSGFVDSMDAKAVIDNIDSAIAKYGGLETTTELYRAVKVSAFSSHNTTYAVLFNGIDTNDLNQVYCVLKTLEGKELVDLGYISTSPSYSASFAKYKSSPIVLDIIADKGTAGAYINQFSSLYNIENEFLLARDTVLQIVEVLAPEKDFNGLEKIVVKCVIK